MRNSIVTRLAVLIFCVSTFAMSLAAEQRDRSVKERTPIRKAITKVLKLITPNETMISIPKP